MGTPEEIAEVIVFRLRTANCLPAAAWSGRRGREAQDARALS
jgi:hypothetical protein